ncbi:hypothetical protein GOV11_02110 [Candidatus Woesearchaeota archaeon]|nr:hypothetical protein [Candidatus Woesearchaeota archaeon]
MGEIFLNPRNVLDLLKNRGHDFVTGIPCGVLSPLIAEFKRDSLYEHLIVQNEPEAIGVAAGAYLGGKRPVLYMQNSGFLKSINEYGSLLIPNEIPILNIVSYRGCPGENAPQHFTTGRITKSVLDILNIPWAQMEDDVCVIDSVFAEMEEKSVPGVILIKRSTFGESHNPQNCRQHVPEILVNERLNVLDILRREEALDAILSATTEMDAILSGTGLMSRSIYERNDGPNKFYTAGAFGLVSSIGLGFSLAKPDTGTVVIDGDASLLSNLGSLISTGRAQPRNLVHVVVDNHAYGSCQEEPSCSDIVKFPQIAAHHGFRRVFSVNNPRDISEAVRESLAGGGPALIHIPIQLGGRRDFKRPMNLPYISRRFKKTFS